MLESWLLIPSSRRPDVGCPTSKANVGVTSIPATYCGSNVTSLGGISRPSFSLSLSSALGKHQRTAPTSGERSSAGKTCCQRKAKKFFAARPMLAVPSRQGPPGPVASGEQVHKHRAQATKIACSDRPLCLISLYVRTSYCAVVGAEMCVHREMGTHQPGFCKCRWRESSRLVLVP
ncbi:hypothetical protein I7I53_10447 [Histoplasma capsulatum var. duboisii H88]|uniref:Uncharacterized protein n=1 Tax=Ajellomyces capsulatus (strain H88) TaxID=544711 RepID=A0A8A1L738_AJEC8|nr:hypothetical protein I7I53_10447 [Histoplasma capsulatum var. duboisii H88]